MVEEHNSAKGSNTCLTSDNISGLFLVMLDVPSFSSLHSELLSKLHDRINSSIDKFKDLILSNFDDFIINLSELLDMRSNDREFEQQGFPIFDDSEAINQDNVSALLIVLGQLALPKADSLPSAEIKTRAEWCCNVPKRQEQLSKVPPSPPSCLFLWFSLFWQ